MSKKRPKSLVLFGNGINCEYETAYANKVAGFDAELLHLSSLMENMKKIHDYRFINLPGGFLDGDDLGSAKAQAVKWKYQKGNDTEQRFVDELVKFISEGKIVLGICNGFQLLVKTGLLPGLKGEPDRQSVTLTFNDSGKFEDRWVYVRVNIFSNSIFTKGIEKMYLPVRHGEGKLVADCQETLKGMSQEGHVAMQYADEAGEVTMQYPCNPNGSLEGIAALSDSTGRILGMMPHPEAYVHYTQHPRWTREKLGEEGDGIKVFQNAFRYVVENQ